MRARPATHADVPRLAGALAAAFSGDPPLQWLVPEHGRRPVLLRRYFEALLPLYLECGQVWATEDPVGAAAWVAPGRWPLPVRRQLADAPTLLRVFGRHPVRALRGTHAIEHGHPAQRHWYLDYIGVDPAGHGRGTGSALLAPVLEHCDKVREPAYLNAGSSRSRDLYARHGFEVTERFELPGGGPSLWRMWREPRDVIPV